MIAASRHPGRDRCCERGQGIQFDYCCVWWRKLGCKQLTDFFTTRLSCSAVSCTVSAQYWLTLQLLSIAILQYLSGHVITASSQLACINDLKPLLLLQKACKKCAMSLVNADQRTQR